ncbi:MAG: ATP synthase F1 subunit delta [Clostridia bacterium]|nr:ATP synthase F1 subunit delta [Clostridia bacterium]
MTDLAREYGEGLYELCEEENMAEDVLSQLNMLKDCFREQPDFLHLLSNMALPKEERCQIIENTLRGQVHGYVVNFLKILCERNLLHQFYGCEEAYRALYNQDHAIVEAVVTTAAALSDQQREKLMEKLRGMTGKEVSLKEKVDAGLLGGVLLEMDGKRYDNTLRHRLENLQNIFSGNA